MSNHVSFMIRPPVTFLQGTSKKSIFQSPFSVFRDVTFFYSFIFFPRIPLLRYINKCCVNYATGMGYHSFRFICSQNRSNSFSAAFAITIGSRKFPIVAETTFPMRQELCRFAATLKIVENLTGHLSKTKVL